MVRMFAVAGGLTNPRMYGSIRRPYRNVALDLISKLRESIIASVHTNEEYLTEYSNIPLVGKTIIEQQGLLYKTLLEWLNTFREQFEKDGQNEM